MLLSSEQNLDQSIILSNTSRFTRNLEAVIINRIIMPVVQVSHIVHLTWNASLELFLDQGISTVKSYLIMKLYAPCF